MNILVGFNGSKISKRAIELSKKHAKAFNSAITIFMSKPSMNEKASEKEAERFWADLSKTEADMERYKDEFRKESIECITELSTRGLDPGSDLLDYAEKIGADEIIIGVEMKSKVGKLLFGSTAQMIILEANCPVVTVK